MDDDDTKVSRNCKVLNNHWACGRKVDAKSRTGRLRNFLRGLARSSVIRSFIVAFFLAWDQPLKFLRAPPGLAGG